MWNTFWTTPADLPAVDGFGEFTALHFAQLGVCALLAVALVLWFQRCDYRGQVLFCRVLAALMVAGNLLRDVFLWSVGQMSLAYLPLHLCSLSIYVFLLHAFLPERQDPQTGAILQSRFRELLGETGFVLFLPGTIAALLFPEWTGYPALSLMSMHSFLWHTVLCVYPILLQISRRIRPSIRHLWFPVLFLLVITPPIYALDKACGLNFLFVNWPLAGTPLQILYQYMGDWWRVGYAILMLLVVVMIYGIIGLARRASSHFLTYL